MLKNEQNWPNTRHNYQMQAKMAQCKPIQPNVNQNSGFGGGGLSDGGCVLGGGGSELGSSSGALSGGCCGLVVVILLTVVLMVMVSMAVVSVMVVLVVMIVGWGYIFLPSYTMRTQEIIVLRVSGLVLGLFLGAMGSWV